MERALHNIGIANGDWAWVESGEGKVPSLLGITPLAPDRTIDARELDEMGDRVKAGRARLACPTCRTRIAAAH